jgi:hypothetical protein
MQKPPPLPDPSASGSPITIILASIGAASGLLALVVVLLTRTAATLPPPPIDKRPATTAPTTASDEIKAKKIVLVDAKGNARAELRCSGNSTSLTFYSEDGKDTAKLIDFGDESTLSLSGSKERRAIVSSESVTFGTVESKDNYMVKNRLGPKGLAVFGDKKNAILVEPSFLMAYDADGTPRILLSLEKDGPDFRLADKMGNWKAVFRIYEDAGAFALFDKFGKATAARGPGL